MINIATGVVVLGVIGAGYWFVIGKGDPVKESELASGSQLASSVASDVTRTISELKILKQAVASSTEFFIKPAYTDLKDFTGKVSEEPIGRDDPFTMTPWKQKLIDEEEAAKKKASSSSKISSSVAPQSSVATPPIDNSTASPLGL